MKKVLLLGAVVMSCAASAAETPSADERLRAIYTEEWTWRLDQFPGLEGVTKPVPDRLPKEDPGTQEMRLRYWEDCCTSSMIFRARSSRRRNRSTTTFIGGKSRISSRTKNSVTTKF